MKPESLSEQLMFSTLRISTLKGSTGTGFFFQFEFPDNKRVPIIVTNKHVVNNHPTEIVDFFLHVKHDSNPSDENLNIRFNTSWIFHPNQDLCFCFLAPLLHEIKEKQNKEIFFLPITENFIWDNNKLWDLCAVEDVVMVGYPTGLWDRKNNYPLFRKGITSSHPATDFNENNIGAVDMACFPGSSGSPIFILDEKGYFDKKGTLILGGKRVVFLGILYQGPIITSKGDLIIENIPTQQKVSALTPLMINLGYYIKASELLIFKDEIKARI